MYECFLFFATSRVLESASIVTAIKFGKIYAGAECVIGKHAFGPPPPKDSRADSSPFPQNSTPVRL